MRSIVKSGHTPCFAHSLQLANTRSGHVAAIKTRIGVKFFRQKIINIINTTHPVKVKWMSDDSTCIKMRQILIILRDFDLFVSRFQFSFVIFVWPLQGFLISNNKCQFNLGMGHRTHIGAYDSHWGFPVHIPKRARGWKGKNV